MIDSPISREFFEKVEEESSNFEKLLLENGVDPFLAEDVKMKIINLMTYSSPYSHD